MIGKDQFDQLHPETMENARIGYQVAVNLWIHEGNLIWSKFSAMVYANTIVIATIGLLITNKPELRTLRFALSLLGLLLCLSWLWIIKRSFDYHHYWVYSARDLEGLYLNPVKIVTNGELLAKGEEVKFQKPQEFPYQRRRLGPKTEDVTYLVIVLFGLIYTITFFY